MKKLIFLLIIITSIVMVYLVFALSSSRQAIIPIQPVPTPTVFQSAVTPGPTRNPNILPLDVRQSEKEFLEKTQVLQKIPLDSPYFTVFYKNEQHLIVQADVPNKDFAYQEARRRLIENGIDITKIIIEYQ